MSVAVDDRFRPAAPGEPRCRPPTWLGLLLGLASVATIGVSLAFGYFHLMFQVPEWPPDGIARPALGWPVVGLAGLVLIAAPAARAVAVIRRDRRRALRFHLALAGLLGLAVLGLQAWGYASLPFAHDENAYTSLFVTLGAFHTLSLVTAVSFNTVTLVRAGLGHFDGAHHQAVRLASLWWYWAVVSGVAVFATIYLGPYLNGGGAS